MAEPTKNNGSYKYKLDEILRRVDEAKLKRSYWLLVGLATIGGFLFGYDQSNIGLVIPFFPYTSHIPLLLGLEASSGFLGAAIGAIIVTSFADKSGRKVFLIADMIIYILGALISGASISYAMLIIGRIIIGVAIGADSAIATAYISEFAPAKDRGRLTGFQQMMINIAILGAYLIGILVYGVAPGAVTTIGWRTVFYVAAIPAVIGLIFRARIPESPRWLMIHKKVDTAKKVLETNFGITATTEEITEASNEWNEKLKSYKIPRSLWKGVGIIVGFAFFDMFCGIDIPFIFGPEILSTIHLFPSVVSPVRAEIYDMVALLPIGAALVGGGFYGWSHIDTWGRKKISEIAWSGMVITGLIAAILWLFKLYFAVLIFLYLYTFVYSVSIGMTAWVLQGESSTSEARGLIAGVIAISIWIMDFANVTLYPVMSSRIGFTGAWIVYSILSAGALVWTILLLKETKGVPVEEMDKLYA
ncbi:MAG: MFS transporter [Candidatus Micrarchaeaceae archaeon]